MNAAVGSYLSPQGMYDTYTQGNTPAIVLGSSANRLQVRCYVDEILISRLPAGKAPKAHMSVRARRPRPTWNLCACSRM